MIAELEIFHSRPVAPTRRVALGHRLLPTDGDPGVGVLLLGSIVARHVGQVPTDLMSDLIRLTHQVERGYRIAQPRLRHRFQADRVGLLRSRHRAYQSGSALYFTHHDEHGTAGQQILGALYAVADQDLADRRDSMALLRRAMRFGGEASDTEALLGFLLGVGRQHTLAGVSQFDPRSWALEILGLNDPERSKEFGKEAVNKSFRSLLREAHPDHGSVTQDPAARIAELSEARRILLR